MKPHDFWRENETTAHTNKGDSDDGDIKIE